MQRLEPLLVKAFVAKLAVEALDVAVLHGPAWLDQDLLDAVAMCRGHQGSAGELRTVVGAHGQRLAAKDSGTVEQPGGVLTRDAPVNSDVHALVAEVIGHRQTFDAPAVGQAVTDEVHAPHLVDALGQLQRHAFRGGTPDLLAPAHGQVQMLVIIGHHSGRR